MSTKFCRYLAAKSFAKNGAPYFLPKIEIWTQRYRSIFFMKNSSNDLFEGNNLPARYSQAIVFLIKFMKADFRILFYFFFQ